MGQHIAGDGQQAWAQAHIKRRTTPVTGMLSLIRALSRIAAFFLLLSALLGCTPPPKQVDSSKVLAVDSIAEVLLCKYKGTVIAIGQPKERQKFSGWEHPLDSSLRSTLVSNAKNCVHELKGDRILARTKLFKGTQQFDFFRCPKSSVLDAYTHEIDAQRWKKANLSRLCKNPGSAQGADFSMYCKGEFPPNPPKGQITSKQQDKLTPGSEIIPCR